jgi:hypothetical protein
MLVDWIRVVQNGHSEVRLPNEIKTPVPTMAESGSAASPDDYPTMAPTLRPSSGRDASTPTPEETDGSTYVPTPEHTYSFAHDDSPTGHYNGKGKGSSSSGKGKGKGSSSSGKGSKSSKSSKSTDRMSAMTSEQRAEFFSGATTTTATTLTMTVVVVFLLTTNFML